MSAVKSSLSLSSGPSGAEATCFFSPSMCQNARTHPRPCIRVLVYSCIKMCPVVCLSVCVRVAQRRPLSPWRQMRELTHELGLKATTIVHGATQQSTITIQNARTHPRTCLGGSDYRHGRTQLLHQRVPLQPPPSSRTPPSSACSVRRSSTLWSTASRLSPRFRSMST